jgi:hypothetical protein
LSRSRGKCKTIVRPKLLIIQNDAVHIAATNPDHRRATGLTFQGDEAEGFLHTGMNEQIRRAIQPRQLKRIAAIAPPRHRLAACLELLQLITLGTIPDYQEVILVRPAIRQEREAFEKRVRVLFHRQSTNVKK